MSINRHPLPRTHKAMLTLHSLVWVRDQVWGYKQGPLGVTEMDRTPERAQHGDWGDYRVYRHDDPNYHEALDGCQPIIGLFHTSNLMTLENLAIAIQRARRP